MMEPSKNQQRTCLASDALLASQSVGDARDSHAEHHQAAADAKHYASRHDPPTCLTKKGHAKLCHKSCVALNCLHRHNSHKREAHQQVDRRHHEHAARKCNGQRAPRIAHLAGDLACLPPATETEKRTDRRTSNGAHKWIGSSTALHEG